MLHAARWKYGTQKKSPKIAIWAPSHNFVGLYLHNYCTYRQSEKNLLSSNISSTCPHNMVNFGPLASEIISLVWGTPANFNGFRLLAALLHGTLVVGVSQTAAFNRGRHLYSAERPSRWTFAHISSLLLPRPLDYICRLTYARCRFGRACWTACSIRFDTSTTSPVKLPTEPTR